VWSDAVPDERVERLPHRFWVAAHDRGGGLDVADGIKVLPGRAETGVAGELPEESPLRPPVALTERMQCVDLAQVIGQPPDEEPRSRPRRQPSSRSSRKTTAAEDSMYCGRQNIALLAMATVRIGPAHW
jgi:hypothetical protein